MSTKNDTQRAWFERVWTYREEEVYPRLFGRERKGIYTLSAEILKGTFKQASIDPRWLHHGVLQFAPTETRQSWLYVTSGMSNDWESDSPAPTGVSVTAQLERNATDSGAIVHGQRQPAGQVAGLNRPRCASTPPPA